MQNLMGDQLNEPQQRLVACYEDLKQVVERHGPDLAPYEQRNALKALAALWQIVNGLDLDPDHLYDLGA